MRCHGLSASLHMGLLIVLVVRWLGTRWLAHKWLALRMGRLQLVQLGCKRLSCLHAGACRVRALLPPLTLDCMLLLLLLLQVLLRGVSRCCFSSPANVEGVQVGP